jgi:hypothetical protein
VLILVGENSNKVRKNYFSTVVATGTFQHIFVAALRVSKDTATGLRRIHRCQSNALRRGGEKNSGSLLLLVFSAFLF